MLLTASRSRREGVGARASLEAAALEVAALETAAGAAGAGGSGRRRPPVRAATTIAAPFSGAAPWGLGEASFGWSWAFGEEEPAAVREFGGVGCAAAGLRSGLEEGAASLGAGGKLARRPLGFASGIEPVLGDLLTRARHPAQRRRPPSSKGSRSGDLASRRDPLPARRPPVAKSRRVRRSTRPSGRRD